MSFLLLLSHHYRKKALILQEKLFVVMFSHSCAICTLDSPQNYKSIRELIQLFHRNCNMIVRASTLAVFHLVFPFFMLTLLRPSRGHEVSPSKQTANSHKQLFLSVQRRNSARRADRLGSRKPHRRRCQSVARSDDDGRADCGRHDCPVLHNEMSHSENQAGDRSRHDPQSSYSTIQATFEQNSNRQYGTNQRQSRSIVSVNLIALTPVFLNSAQRSQAV